MFILRVYNKLITDSNIYVWLLLSQKQKQKNAATGSDDNVLVKKRKIVWDPGDMAPKNCR